MQISPAEAGGIAVLYLVGSWDEGRWTEQWFNSFQVSSKADKEKIGFSQGK